MSKIIKVKEATPIYKKSITTLGEVLRKQLDNPFSIEPDCLFFSDFHLHERKEFSRIDPITGLNTRLTEGLNILDQIIEIIDKHHINSIYHLGDVFELKDRVPNHIIIEFQTRLLAITSKHRFFSLLGNHDFNLPNYPILSIFESGNNDFNFINKPGSIDSSLYVIPFQRNWEDFKREWKKAHEFPISILLIHQDIPGGVYETGKSIGGVWDLETDPGILYLAGHLHKPQKVHGIQFLGSPYPTKFLPQDDGDYYIWLYNSKTKQLRPLQLNYSKFISLNYYELDYPNYPIDFKEIIQDNYVRIVGEVNKEDIDPKIKKDIKINLEKLGAKAVIFNIKIKQQSQTKIESKTLEGGDKEIISQYAKENVSDLDVKRLIDVGMGVYEGL